MVLKHLKAFKGMFVTNTKEQPDYDEVKILTLWESEQLLLIGYNQMCLKST